MADNQIPTFIINLEQNAERRESMLKQFAQLDGFKPRVIAGCLPSSLPRSVCLALSQKKEWAGNKDSIARFIAHVVAWEEIAASSDPFAIVLEDDVRVTRLTQLRKLKIPKDAGIVFLNAPMSAATEGPLRLLPISHGLRNLDPLHRGPSSEGYLITPRAAAAVLEACVKDLYFGHLGGRLLRYATGAADLAELPPNSWIEEAVRKHHHPTLHPQIGIVKGYCVSLPMVAHGAATAVSAPKPAAPVKTVVKASAKAPAAAKRPMAAPKSPFQVPKSPVATPKAAVATTKAKLPPP